MGSQETTQAAAPATQEGGRGPPRLTRKRLPFGHLVGRLPCWRFTDRVMWTVIRFALSSAEPARYRAAFELLRRSGFQPHRRPGDTEGEVLPASVVADLLQDPAVVSRAIFEALAGAHLRPVMVTGAHVEVRARAHPPLPVAPR